MVNIKKTEELICTLEKIRSGGMARLGYMGIIDARKELMDDVEYGSIGHCPSPN